MNSDEQLRYPIGRFQAKPVYTPAEIKEFIDRIEALPEKIEKAFGQLTQKQMDTTYREGGWTARQVLHHLPDSHLNAYIRTKWTLTEETPTIKVYDEKAWAETPETSLDPLISIHVLKSIHQKWVALLRHIKAEDFQKSFFHPESQIHVSLARQMATYAWHGEHHLGHLQIILKK